MKKKNIGILLGAAILVFSNTGFINVRAEEGTLLESEYEEPSLSFEEAVKNLTIESEEDVSRLAELVQEYESMSGEEKASVSGETLELLENAKSYAAVFNHSHNGVSVSGNLPWYVQVTATRLPDEGRVNDNTWSVVPYELELRDVRDGSVYTLPEGESVTVTMPVPETLYQGKFVIYHYKEDGSVETIIPKINGDTMSFTATSFSPYSVAGSTVLAGIGITTDLNYPDEGEDSEVTSNNDSDNESGESSEAASGQSTASGISGDGGSTNVSGNSSSRTENEVVRPLSPVNTADENVIWFWTALGTAAFGAMSGCVVMRKNVQKRE